MSKPPKFSVVEGDGAPPGDEEALCRHGVILPFYPNADDSLECEQYIKRVFEAVVKHYGEDEARRIFGPYGKPRTKREKRLEENTILFMEYCIETCEAKKSNRKPNVHQLALRLAKENNTDPVAMERKIWRAIRDKKVHRYLQEH
jgi:hypothetical protein